MPWGDCTGPWWAQVNPKETKFFGFHWRRFGPLWGQSRLNSITMEEKMQEMENKIKEIEEKINLLLQTIKNK